MRLIKMSHELTWLESENEPVRGPYKRFTRLLYHGAEGKAFTNLLNYALERGDMIEKTVTIEDKHSILD